MILFNLGDTQSTLSLESLDSARIPNTNNRTSQMTADQNEGPPVYFYIISKRYE